MNKALEKIRFLILLDLIVIVILFIATLCPNVTSPAQAIDTSPLANIANTATLSIAAPRQVLLDILPEGGMTFAQSNDEIVVATTNASGYSLYIKSDDKDGAMTNANIKEASQISSICNNACERKLADFPANSWGFSVSTEAITDDTNYHSTVPAQEEKPFYQTDGASEDTLVFSIGMMIDTELPAGIYNGTILISAVANPQTVTTLKDISTMQEIDSEICANTKIGVEKQLIDTRDNKSYWVAKMEDGNCWMTQNLALDITSNYKTKLTSNNTDIPVGYVWPDTSWREINTATGTSVIKTGMQVTETATPTTHVGQTDELNLSMRSWNLGQYVMGAPFLGTQCGSEGAGSNPANCAGFVNVANNWSDDFEARMGTWAGAETYVTINHPTNTYDAHYLIGNFYSWNAATAGAGGNVGGNWITSSICPKGWQLPRNVGEKSLDGLVTSYGMSNKVGGADKGDDNELGYNLLKLPLSFIPAGLINIGLGYYGYGGTNGYVWTSYATNGGHDKAGYLAFTNSSLAISNNTRWLGYSVRCVAR